MDTKTLTAKFHEQDGDRIRKGTPEKVSDTIPKYYFTQDLIIRLCDDEFFGPQEWDPYIPVVYYDVFLRGDDTEEAIAHLVGGDARYVGNLSVNYDYEAHTMAIDNVGIVDNKYLRKGYGVQMYAAVPEIALPDGRMPKEAGFTFITEAPSPEAERVWQALARRGFCTNVGDYMYIWNSYDDLDLQMQQ